MKKFFAVLALLFLTGTAHAQVIINTTGSKVLLTTGGHPVLSSTKWQGAGNGGMGFSPANPLFSGGTNWSSTLRYPFYSNVAFSKIKIVLPTFYPQLVAGVITDTDFVNDYDFQVCLEYPYVHANSGLSARSNCFLFSGVATGHYTAAGGPYGGLVSDELDLPFTVPAATQYGLWITIENHAGSGSASNTLPVNITTNNIERYEGIVNSTSSQISAATASTATSIAHIGTSISGFSQGYLPFMALISVPTSTRAVGQLGDCIGIGVGEGNPTTTADGDADGNAAGDRGFMSRWVGTPGGLGLNYVNFSIGTDRYQFASPTNWQRRLTLWQLSNVTGVFSELGSNDIGAGRTLVQTEASAISAFGLITGVLPSVGYWQSTFLPDSTSTDNWATVVNQTAATHFGIGSPAANWNDAVRAGGSAMGANGGVNATIAIENSVNSFLFSADGTVKLWSPDGRHPNSHGAAAIATGLGSVNPGF